MRPWIASCLPAPPTIVVLSLSIIIRLHRPRSLIATVSSLIPSSSATTLPPVRIAMSSSIALRRSPNPGAFTATQRRVPRSLLTRSEEHTSELQSPCNLVCRLLLEKKNNTHIPPTKYLAAHHI